MSELNSFFDLVVTGVLRSGTISFYTIRINDVVKINLLSINFLYLLSLRFTTTRFKLLNK